MKVVFIGAGNVATHLSKALFKQSFDILQIYSRTMESAKKLANEVNALPIDNLQSIAENADLYIFSLKDSVLENAASQLSGKKGIWLHTSGSISIDIFRRYSEHYGVFYPFQTFSKERQIDWQNVPIFLEATDTGTFNKIDSIAKQLTEKAFPLSSEKRKYLHLTGVFACNFTNHMYTLSKEFLQKVNLPFDVVLPLIDETASKIHSLSPEEAQTGPAIRYDENIINKHLDLIEDESVKQIYKLISENIHKSHNKK